MTKWFTHSNTDFLYVKEANLCHDWVIRWLKAQIQWTKEKWISVMNKWFSNLKPDLLNEWGMNLNLEWMTHWFKHWSDECKNVNLTKRLNDLNTEQKKSESRLWPSDSLIHALNDTLNDRRVNLSHEWKIHSITDIQGQWILFMIKWFTEGTDSVVIWSNMSKYLIILSPDKQKPHHLRATCLCVCV